MKRGVTFAAILLGLGATDVRPTLITAQTPPPIAQRPDGDEIETGLRRSEALVNASKYLEAREQALRVLAWCEELQDQQGIGRARHVLGLVAAMMGDAAEARIHFEAAIAAFERIGHLRGRGRATLGLLPVWSPDGATQMQLLERTVSDASASGDQDLEGRALHFWGDAVFHVGDYEAALEKLEQAASLFAATGDARALGTVHNSLGRLYRRHGRVDLALDEQLAALALHERFPTTFEYLQSLNAVGVTYQALGDSRQARAYLDRALTLAEQIGSPRVLDFIRGTLAVMLVEHGEHARAARLLEPVVARGVDVHTVGRLSSLSKAYLKLGRLEEARAAAQRAVDLCPAGSATDCLVALRTRSSVYGALRNPTAALEDLRSAIDRLEDVRARLVPADFLKQQFALPQEGIFSSAIALQLGQGHTAEALETAERARARAFIDLLAGNQIVPPEAAATPPAPAFPGPATTDRTPTAAAPDQSPLVLRGANARAPAGARPGSAPLDLPSPGAAKAAEARDLRALAARLRSTLLVYWVADDELFIWVVSAAEKIHTVRVPVRAAKLRELVRATLPFSREPASPSGKAERRVVTRGEMSISLGDRDEATWRELYTHLIRPVRSVLPGRAGALLTIVPHGPLASLSFAALMDQRGRYLLEDYALHYVPAAGVLQFTAGKRQPAARAGALMLVADPTLAPRSRLDPPLPRLPGARTEVRAISGFVRRDQVTLLEGGAATESAVRLDAPRKSVLHFATHAIVRDDDPFASFLALRPSAADAAGDGYLTAREIYGLNLRSDLVVLSACRSGSGHVSGDGVATFARAFLYAGTPTVITSLWDVADQPTNRLLPDFYRSWIGGQSKARALRTAALTLLRDLRAGRVEVLTPAGAVRIPEHPVFWAGFALIGEPD